MNQSEIAEKAAQFYKENATNVVNVPRPGHPEDKSGWDGVRRASEARFIAQDALVMTLADVFDFAAKFVERAIAESQVPQPPIIKRALLSANEWAAKFPLYETDSKADFKAAAIVYEQTLEALTVAEGAIVPKETKMVEEKLGDGEPNPPPQKVGGVYTGLRDGCTSDPSGLHECGVEENHKLCVCWSCGKSWPNPE